jgi:hypothetical protein
MNRVECKKTRKLLGVGSKMPFNTPLCLRIKNHVNGLPEVRYRQLYSDRNHSTTRSNAETLAGDAGDVDGELWFQQCGTTAHTARESMER